MNRGFDSPGVDIFRSEEVTTPNTTGQVIYGIVGPTVKGEYGYTEVVSIKQLHELYGYAYLGDDADGNRVLSDAIIAAERVLSNANKIIFSRVGLNSAEEAKFNRKSQDMLNFTIANKDTSIRSIKVHYDGEVCTVTDEAILPDGAISSNTLCQVKTEADLKKALEYEGTLINVVVPDGYFNRIKPTSSGTEEDPVIEYHDDIYVPSFDALNINLTTEIEEFANNDAVNVQVLAAPLGSIIEIGKETIEEKAAAYEVVNAKILNTIRERGSNSKSSDCVALFDYPKGIKFDEAKTVFDSAWYRGVDEEEVVIAYPAVQIPSIYTGDVVELGSSGILLDRMSYTDTKMYPWIAPAGYGNNKGVIPGVISVNETLSKSMRDTLYAMRINPVVKFVGKGVVVFGNRTLKQSTPYQDPSLLEKVNVVRLSNYIVRVGYDVSLNLLFDPNDPTTWDQWTAAMTTEMEKIKANRGVEKYKVKMDEETVTDEDRVLGKAPAIVYVLPIGALEYIPIYLTLTDNREVFGEEE